MLEDLVKGRQLNLKWGEQTSRLKMLRPKQELQIELMKTLKMIEQSVELQLVLQPAILEH